MDMHRFEAVTSTAAAHVRAHWGDEHARVFENCFANTLSTTIRFLPDGSAFMLTGDIPAMWLRDSSVQLSPYLHFAADFDDVSDLITRVIKRQFTYILIDPYANAFNEHPRSAGHANDRTAMSPWVWERKYEIDSLAYPLLLSADLWRTTGRTDHLGQDFVDATRAIMQLWRIEQDHEARSTYRFERFDAPATDTLRRGGHGEEVIPVGLTWAGFRPSDDACEHGYNIPGNALAAVALAGVRDIAAHVLGDHELAADAWALAHELHSAVLAHGVVDHPEHGALLAYEVDGGSKALLMDDANAPSLLSLPWFGWCERTDPLYLSTRSFVLSESNPYYYVGIHAAGIGSPHTPPRHVWPISLSMQALTGTDAQERADVVNALLSTHAGTDLMHESFDVDNPESFTRPWFSWANAMFCEALLAHALPTPYVRPVVDWTL